MNRSICFIAGLLLITPCVQGGISLTASTDKPQYYRGEALNLAIAAWNSDPNPVTLGFGSTIQSIYFLDSSYYFPQAGATVLTYRTIPGNGSYTWNYRHLWSAHDMGVGNHSYFGKLEGWNSVSRPPIDSPVGMFQVLPNPPPVTSLTTGFETVPGSTTALKSVEEFWPLGVRFRSHKTTGDILPGIASYAGNQYLDITTTTYPPGFNIIADFDSPMTVASMDVSAGAGVQITLLAKDAAGNVVAQTTSDPVPAYRTFVPVSLTSSTPFSTLEWWPSLTNSSVQLDNLSVHAPEPGGLLGFCLLSLAFITRRRT